MNKEKWKVVSAYKKKSILEIFSTYNLVKLIALSGILFCSAFILDYLNIPSQVVQRVPFPILMSVLGVLFVILVACLIDLHIIDLFRIKSVNILDAMTFVGCLSTFIYTIVRVVVLNRSLYTTISFWICIISLYTLVKRVVLRCVGLHNYESKKGNLIDLKDLFENRFERINGKPILLFEKDVDYDLLDRDRVVNQLYNSIIHCQPYQSYVISLEGEWGSGKTTIINNIKRLLKENTISTKEYIYIDDFDPWLYETQDALLLAMLDAIIRHSGIHYSPSRFSGIIKELSETVSNGHWAGNLMQNLFSRLEKPGSSVIKLKERIGRYLHSTNKTIVFVLDNIDRASNDNVIFLFKLISIVFDLPGIIYILAFEKDRISDILKNTHHIDPRFIEKIIQQEIKMPVISHERANELYLTCIDNLLKAYGVPNNEIIEFMPVAQYIIDKTHNIRTFKRMVNSVFPIVFCDDILLKKRDLLAIEAIHFFDPDLFYAIYKAPQFFISHDKIDTDVVKMSFDKSAFNKEGSDFFKNLFDKHKDAQEILSILFPYVKHYKNKMQLESEHSMSDPEAVQISRQSRICSGKYFDLYFSYNTNNYMKIRKNIESMINLINRMQKKTLEVDLKRVEQIVRDYLSVLNNEDHKEWIERLQIYISDVNKDKTLYVAIGLYNLIYCLDNSSYMFGLDARTRAEYIISMLLEKCSEKDFEKFISVIEHDYQKLRIVYRIHYWMASEKLEHTETHKARANLLLECYNDICKKIIEDNIHLYDEPYYWHKNILGLYFYCKQIENVDGFRLYILKNLSEDNIYRVLWDITTARISSQYIYLIEEEDFKIYINDTEKVDRLLEKRPPENKDEEFVRQIYDMFEKGEADEWGLKGVTVPVEKKLQL